MNNTNSAYLLVVSAIMFMSYSNWNCNYWNGWAYKCTKRKFERIIIYYRFYPIPRRKRIVFCSVYYQVQLPTSCRALLLHTTSNRKQIWINIATMLIQPCRQPKYSSSTISAIYDTITHTYLIVSSSFYSSNEHYKSQGKCNAQV